MEATPSPPKVLPTAWSEVLDKVQHALECAGAEAGRREAELDFLCPAASAASGVALAPRVGGERGCLEGERVLQRAERGAAEAAEDLAAAEEALQRWLGAAAAAGQRLADEAGHEV